MGQSKRKRRASPPLPSSSELGPLLGPLKVVAGCVLLFSLVCTPQFWSTAKMTRDVLKDVVAKATDEISSKFVSTSTKENPVQSNHGKSVPSKTESPALNNRDKTNADATAATSTVATATTTTTTTVSTDTSTNTNTSTNTSIDTPITNNIPDVSHLTSKESEADMGMALIKLNHMLYSIDHNISFTTNKTMSTEEYIKQVGGGPFRDDILNELGIVHFQLGNRTEALSMWRQALTFNPASFRVHLNFAQTLFKGEANMTKQQLESDRKEAVDTIKSLLALRDTCEPHKQIGKKKEIVPPTYCKHLLKKKNKKEFQQVLFDGYRFMGTVQSFYEKPFLTETFYKQALKMKPWDQQIHILLAGVYEKMQLFGQAKSYYKQCIKLGTKKKKSKKKKNKEMFKKTKEQVVKEAYEEMDRERMASICKERNQKLKERMKEWVKLKEDGGSEE